jgi:hypothetical protein
VLEVAVQLGGIRALERQAVQRRLAGVEAVRCQYRESGEADGRVATNLTMSFCMISERAGMYGCMRRVGVIRGRARLEMMRRPTTIKDMQLSTTASSELLTKVGRKHRCSLWGRWRWAATGDR